MSEKLSSLPFEITKESKTNTIKDGVDFVIEKNPGLSLIGTKEQYSEYLETVFPNSKLKDIVYRTDIPKTGFDPDRGNDKYGIYFSKDFKIAQHFSKGEKPIYPILLNVENKYDTENPFESHTINGELYRKYLAEGVDAVELNYFHPVLQGNFNEIVTFDPKKIHILGSETDIKMFAEYVKKLI